MWISFNATVLNCSGFLLTQYVLSQKFSVPQVSTTNLVALKKKLKQFLVLPACVATVPTVFLRVADVPRGVILFNHSFSWCMLLIFWLIALATQTSWTASLPCTCSAFTLGAALWWNPEEGKNKAGGKMWIKLLLGFFVHFSNSETPLTVPVSSHQPYIQSSSHPQYSFSCWCWPQLDYLACLLT